MRPPQKGGFFVPKFEVNLKRGTEIYRSDLKGGDYNMSEITKFDGSSFRADGASNDFNKFRVMPNNIASIFPEDREVRGFASVSEPKGVNAPKVQTAFPERLTEVDRKIVASLPKEGVVWKAPGK